MGHVTVVGGCRAKAPSTGILASALPVGSTVKLMEGGSAVEYLVVNQGIPSNSNLYDASCDGTWLLRKDIRELLAYNSSENNSYKESAAHNYINDTFLNLFGGMEQTVIKQVKIPYVNGTVGAGIASGASGLSAKAFLLSGYEIGIGGADYLPRDGAKLDYFDQIAGADPKRIAYLNGSASFWWLRSPYTYRASTTNVWYVDNNGGCNTIRSTYQYGVRPALILYSNALFDKTTMLLKGVA